MRRRDGWLNAVGARIRRAWIRGLLCLAILTAIPWYVGHSQLPVQDRLKQDMAQHTDWSASNPTVDPKVQAALNAWRRKQMAADTAKLVALANQIKTESDNKDALSMESIRQVEQIEKLAQSVRNTMRASLDN